MVRRALAVVAGENYLRLAVTFALIASVSRLLTPAEIGVSAIGTGIVGIALGLRGFATSEFLIQRREVKRDDVRTSFTLLFLLTVLITSAMFALAPWFGLLYGEEKLARFVRVAVVAGLIEAVSLPITALMRRDMTFGALAFINAMSTVVTAATTILLALGGFSYMSFAWAAVAAACTTTVLAFCFRPEPSMFRPALRSWREIVAFGSCNGASYLINRAYEALPQLVLGQMFPPSAVGLYNRANVLAGIPDKIITTSVLSVAFPALAAEIRKGSNVKGPYLRALGCISVLYWPAQVVLALLAYPVVSLLLGQQWLEVVPLLQVIAIASLAWFAMTMTPPILLAVGANRDRVRADLFGRSVAAIALCSSASFGIMAMAASQLVNLPFQMVVSLCFVRRHVAFQWSEVWAALWKSAIVTASSVAGPICVVAVSASGFALSIPAAAVAVLSAIIGWLAGVLITRHPVLLELKRGANEIVETSFVQRCWRLRGRIIAHG